MMKNRSRVAVMNDLAISRKWSMPNSKTFAIKPIAEIIEKYIVQGMVIVDPFANTSSYGTITNDLDASMPTTFHMDATDFLKTLHDECADLVLYDPPYSPRQVSECYKRFDMAVNMETTQASYWSNQKKEIERICKTGGTCITFGWNSGGIEKNTDLKL